MVMPPYRKAAPGAADPAAAPAAAEEPIVYLALCVIGAIPVGIALIRGGVFGVEATLGLIMALAGAVGLLAGLPDRMRSRFRK